VEVEMTIPDEFLDQLLRDIVQDLADSGVAYLIESKDFDDAKLFMLRYILSAEPIGNSIYS
jgi:hypothetical protein